MGAGIFTYTTPAPDAEGVALTGPTSGPETNVNHTAYHAGMSAWCSNCHADMHQSTDFFHPSGENLGIINANYNTYVASGNHGGNPNPYLAAVPFEDPGTAVNSDATLAGVTSKVMCLTCHRSHASSGPYSGRWDFNVTFLEEDGVVSGSYKIPNPTGVLEQRSMCNKCHLQDPVITAGP
jgi:hypothetical protein